MFYISDERQRLQVEEIKALLKQTYWADKRDEDTIKISIQNSICYGAYLKENDKQIGFARVITDYATTYYICDVIVDSKYRRMGIGKALVNSIVNDERLKNLGAFLATADAHGLYERYGFRKAADRYMGKRPE